MSSLAERSYLSIGQVVNLLRGTYPDLSNSKIRFLEDEGLITPHRTPKGYRQYSKADVDRLEVILHLETRQKLHPIEDVPDILGVDIAFLRQLSDNDLIRIIRSPQNRELIDGRDFEIIRHCAELSRFHIEPRNLRQYVIAANRESALFEQVLIGMLGSDDSDDDREAKLDRAFKTLHDLTDGVRTALLRNRVFESLNAVVEDADVDAIDDEITRAQQAAQNHVSQQSYATGHEQVVSALDASELAAQPIRVLPVDAS